MLSPSKHQKTGVVRNSVDHTKDLWCKLLGTSTEKLLVIVLNARPGDHLSENFALLSEFL